MESKVETRRDRLFENNNLGDLECRQDDLKSVVAKADPRIRERNLIGIFSSGLRNMTTMKGDGDHVGQISATRLELNV